MKKILFFLALLIINVNIFGHKEITHKYITVRAFQLLRMNVGEIPTMSANLGTTDNYYNGDYAFHRQKITSGAYREDHDDLVYGYDSHIGDGIGMDFDDWLISITHFWNADAGDNSTNDIYYTGWPSHSHYNLTGHPFPNAYTKFMKYANPNKFWEIKFKLNPGQSTFTKSSGGSITVTQYGGVGFKYNSLKNLYKTGEAWLTGYYGLNGDWVICNYQIILGQGWRDALAWEILGRMCHLLQDMSVPAHVNVDEHGSFPDSYENYMGEYSNYFVSDVELSQMTFINPYYYQSSNPLHFLMYVVQQVTNHFYSRGDDQNGYGNNTLGGDGTTAERNFINTYYPLSTLGEPITRYNAHTGNWNSNIKAKTYPLVIGATAGLLYWFATEVGLNILQPNFTVTPTINNAGSGRAGTYIYKYFQIQNTGGLILNLTIQSNFWDIEFIGESSTHYLQKTLYPGNSYMINYKSSFGRYDYGPFSSTVRIDNDAYNIHKTHTLIGERLLPDFCFGETLSRSASPEEQLFDGAFIGYFGFENDSITFNKNKPIKERLDFAYELLKKDKKEKVQDICKEIIELYPESEMSVSFYAMGLLWEAAYSDEVLDFEEKDLKKYLKDLTKKKNKHKINGYAQLLLSLFDIGNDIEGLEELYSNYEYDILKELALFHQFIHYYTYKQDNSKAREVSNKLDKMFKDSRYGYEAHLIFGDEGYTIEGLKELIKKLQSSLLAKRIENKTDILSEMPTKYALSLNYPNPFNPSTTIKYSVPTVSKVKLSIYNMMGQLIKTLVNETKAPGFYYAEWDGTNKQNMRVTSGIYVYRFESGNYVQNSKMILLK